MLTTSIEMEKLTPEDIGAYSELFHRCGIQRILVDVLDFIELGEAREKRFRRLKEILAYLHDEGFEAGIWTNALGWGNLRDKAFLERFPDENTLHIVNFSGKGSYAICVLDKAFRAEMNRWMRDFAAAGADVILIDDDFILSARNALGCGCREHMALLSKRIGRTVTGEDMKVAYSGAPNELRNQFLASQAETIMDYVKGLRAAADEANPSARFGLAASYTLFDIEGVDVEEMLGVLAGKGNRPFLRLSGATYWAKFAPRFDNCAQSLGAVQETVRSNRAFFRNTDIEILDENDCYPREHCITPATYVELYDRITLADDDDGRLKYIVQGPFHAPIEPGGKAYVNAHIRDLKYDDAIMKMFHGRTACGWRVHQSRHLILESTLPEKFAGEIPIMSWCTQSRAGAFLTGNSQYTSYDENSTGPVVAFWENARQLTEEELNSGVLLDAAAAKILTDMGIDVGLRGMTQCKCPGSETFHGTGRTAACVLDRPGVFYRMELADGAEVLSTFHSTDGDVPACYFYENAKGQRFGVYAFDGNFMDYGSFQRAVVTVAYTPGRRAQLNELYQLLSGGTPLPMAAQLDINPGFYTLVRRSDSGCMSIMFCNIFDDAVEETPFKLAAPARLVSCINGEAEVNGDVLTLKYMRPFDWCALEIENI